MFSRLLFKMDLLCRHGWTLAALCGFSVALCLLLLMWRTTKQWWILRKPSPVLVTYRVPTLQINVWSSGCHWTCVSILEAGLYKRWISWDHLYIATVKMLSSSFWWLSCLQSVHFHFRPSVFLHCCPATLHFFLSLPCLVSSILYLSEPQPKYQLPIAYKLEI